MFDRNRFARGRLVLLLGLAASAGGCEQATTAAPGAGKLAALARVETVRPVHQTFRRSVDQPGQVEAFEVTPIHAKIGGYVRSWNVNIGDAIKKGQTLAELDVPETVAEAEQKRALIEHAQAMRVQSQAAVKVAQADIKASEAKRSEVSAGVSRTEADLERWRSEYQRVEQLFRERAQTGSLLDETRNKLRSSESARAEIDAHLKTADAALAQSQAELDKARADLVAAEAGIVVAQSESKRVDALLGYSKIIAPYDGVVIRRNVDTGSLTVPGAQGEPLFVVARSDTVTVAAAVPEMFAAAVDLGDRALIRLQAIPGRIVEGKVTRTAYALDPKSRTLRAEVDLPNPEGKLHPGMYANVSIICDEHLNALTLPVSAVIRDGEKVFCVVVRQGHVERIPLVVGQSDGVVVEVASGLGDDERVVKANGGSLTDGLAVELVEPANPPGPAAKP